MATRMPSEVRNTVHEVSENFNKELENIANTKLNSQS